MEQDGVCICNECIDLCLFHLLVCKQEHMQCSLFFLFVVFNVKIRCWISFKWCRFILTCVTNCTVLPFISLFFTIFCRLVHCAIQLLMPLSFLHICSTNVCSKNFMFERAPSKKETTASNNCILHFTCCLVYTQKSNSANGKPFSVMFVLVPSGFQQKPYNFYIFVEKSIFLSKYFDFLSNFYNCSVFVKKVKTKVINFH